MNRKFLTATALFTQLAAGTALACGDDTAAQWHAPDANMPPTSIIEARAKLKAEQGVIVQPSELQSRCGPETYTITDAKDGQVLGEFPMPQKGDGRDILVRTQQVLGASKNETKKLAARLEQARKDFRDDVNTLEAELGVQMYDPNALPLEDRFPGKDKQRIYVTTESCEQVTDKKGRTGIYYSSSSPLSHDTRVNTFTYIPGRNDYSEATIYQKGDARKTLLSDPELRHALEQRAAMNARYCSGHRSDLGNAWKQINAILTTESTDDLMKGAYARYTRMFSMDNARIVESASLRNSHAINITYKKDNSSLTLYMAGEVADILRIEQDLTRKGILTDRENRLDIRGEIEKEHNEIPAPLPVGP